MAKQYSGLVLRAGASAALAAGLSACALGPDFQTPAPPASPADRYTPAPLAARTASAPASATGGAAQYFSMG